MNEAGIPSRLRAAVATVALILPSCGASASEEGTERESREPGAIADPSEPVAGPQTTAPETKDKRGGLPSSAAGPEASGAGAEQVDLWRKIDGSPAQWLAPLPADGSLRRFEDIAVDASGDLVLLASVTGSDYKGEILIKFTSNGQELWRVQLTNGGSASTVELDGEGNIFVSVRTPGDLIDGGDPEQRIQAIVKYAPDGMLLWTAVHPNAETVADDSFIAWPHAVNAAGEVFVISGKTTVSKYTPNGQWVWDQGIDRLGQGHAQVIAAGPDGEAFIVAQQSEQQSWFGRFSATGAPDWSRYFPAGLFPFSAQMVVSDGGALTIAASSYWDLNGDGTDSDDSVLLTYSGQSEQLWVQQPQTEGLAHNYDLAFDPAGNLVVVSGLSAEFYDGYVTLCDPSGNVLWGEHLMYGEFIDGFRVSAGYPGLVHVLVSKNGNIARLEVPDLPPGQ